MKIQHTSNKHIQSIVTRVDLKKSDYTNEMPFDCYLLFNDEGNAHKKIEVVDEERGRSKNDDGVRTRTD
jgi:hypothetical protein